MNYTLLSKTEHTAKRKAHRCIWCPELIALGERYVAERSVYDGDLQSFQWHPECYTAAQDYFHDEEEFEPHACRRGTTEEA